MKHLILLTLLASFFSISAFAVGETTTECPMMKHQGRGGNTKLNLETSVKKPASNNSSKGKGV